MAGKGTRRVKHRDQESDFVCFYKFPTLVFCVIGNIHLVPHTKVGKKYNFQVTFFLPTFLPWHLCYVHAWYLFVTDNFHHKYLGCCFSTLFVLLCVTISQIVTALICTVQSKGHEKNLLCKTFTIHQIWSRSPKARIFLIEEHLQFWNFDTP